MNDDTEQAAFKIFYRIFEKIKQEAEVLVEQKVFEFKYIKLAIELKKKVAAEFRDDPKNLKKLQGNLDDFEAFCFAYLRIKTKSGKPVRIIILKAGQMGFATTTEAIIYYLSHYRKQRMRLFPGRRYRGRLRVIYGQVDDDLFAKKIDQMKLRRPPSNNHIMTPMIGSMIIRRA